METILLFRFRVLDLLANRRRDHLASRTSEKQSATDVNGLVYEREGDVTFICVTLIECVGL